jgi:hypothetical protein
VAFQILREKLEKLVARQDSLFAKTGWHSKLAFM